MLIEGFMKVKASLLALTLHLNPGPPPVPPVKVEVMSESLCVDCQSFFENSLIPTYRKLGPSVIDLHVIPFGNSRIDYDTKTVTCQHGEAECDANVWEQCAVDQYPPTIYLEFFDCLESGILPMGHRDEPFDESLFRGCIERTTPLLRGETSNEEHIDFAKLKACHDDPDTAWSMQSKFAKRTPPNHKFVPWVLVDHQFVDVDEEDFFQYVCRSYMSKGGSHPACVSMNDMALSESEKAQS